MNEAWQIAACVAYVGVGLGVATATMHLGAVKRPSPGLIVFTWAAWPVVVLGLVVFFWLSALPEGKDRT